MYLADNKAIINTAGLRWVIKSDKTYGILTYHLEIQYKGSNQSIEYEIKDDRDAMFERLSDALTLQNKKDTNLMNYPKLCRCNNCGEIWTDTGDPQCPSCHSEDTELVDDGGDLEPEPA
jgi:Zn finger protein HypA/HybF involved in hydrogenase expression